MHMTDFIRQHLEERWTLGNSFDIPLRIVARDPDLQHRLFRSVILEPEVEEVEQADE
jgi:hypothetical protein